MEAVELVARLMEVAATTAPKSKGENYVRTLVLDKSRLPMLADAMRAYGAKTLKQDFDRDAGSVDASATVILIGLARANVLGLDCGACGFADCRAMQRAPKQAGEFAGPICAYRLLDMGIALGSAAKTASLFNVDNRMMYRIGVVARAMALVDWDFVIGIPLSVSGKNIYFDR